VGGGKAARPCLHQAILLAHNLLKTLLDQAERNGIQSNADFFDQFKYREYNRGM
jgi:hypothetical protein